MSDEGFRSPPDLARIVAEIKESEPATVAIDRDRVIVIGTPTRGRQSFVQVAAMLAAALASNQVMTVRLFDEVSEQDRDDLAALIGAIPAPRELPDVPAFYRDTGKRKAQWKSETAGRRRR